MHFIYDQCIHSIYGHQVDSPLNKMYSEPVTPEQVTHNTLLLIKTVRELGLNYDIQVNRYM